MAIMPHHNHWLSCSLGVYDMEMQIVEIKLSHFLFVSQMNFKKKKMLGSDKYEEMNEGTEEKKTTIECITNYTKWFDT